MLIGHLEDARPHDNPDNKIKDCSASEERHVHVNGFVADGEMFGAVGGVGPFIKEGGREENRNHQKREQRQSLQAGFDETPDSNSPVTSYHVVQQENSEATDCQRADGNVAVQIGLPEVLFVHERANQSGGERDDPDHQGITLQAVELWAESVGGRHQRFPCCAGAAALGAIPLGGGSTGNVCRWSAGTSVIFADSLNWSARI